MTHSLGYHRAVIELHAKGAWLVPLLGKVAILTAWSKERFDASKGELPVGADSWGIIPKTIGVCVVDVDEGPIEYFARAKWPAKSYEVVKSSTPGRHHILTPWLRAWGDVANARWQRGNTAGDLRHASGYVVLYDPAAMMRASAMLPSEKIRQAINALGKGTWQERRATKGKRDAAPDWSPGNRNKTLNDLVFADPDEADEYARMAADAGLGAAEIRATVASARKAAEKRANRLERLMRNQQWDLDFASAKSIAAQCPLPLAYDDDCGEWHAFFAGVGWTLTPMRRVRGMLDDWIFDLASAYYADSDARREALRAADRLRATHILDVLSTSDRVLTDQSQIDPEPHIVALPNGTLYDFEAISEDRDIVEASPDVLRRNLACVPDFDTEPRVWLEALGRSVADAATRETIRAFFKLSLTGYMDYQYALLLKGAAGAGKSLIAHALKVIAGGHFATCTGSRFSAKNTSHEAWKVRVISSRCVVVNEVDGEEWHPDLKAMISGEASDVGRMRQDPVMRTPRCHIVMTANNPPPTPIGDGMARRLLVVDFQERIIGRDRAIFRKIEAEAPAILGWTLRGDMAWLDNPPRSMLIRGYEDDEGF